MVSPITCVVGDLTKTLGKLVGSVVHVVNAVISIVTELVQGIIIQISRITGLSQRNKEGLSKRVGNIGGSLNGVVKVVGNCLLNVTQNIAAALKAVINKLLCDVVDVLQFIIVIVSDLLENVTAAVGRTLAQIGNVLELVIKSVKEILEFLGQFVNGLLGGALSNVLIPVIAVLKELLIAVQSTVNGLEITVHNLNLFLQEILADLYVSLGELGCKCKSNNLIQ